MKSVIRRHWGVFFLSFAALLFIGVQAFLSTHREKAITEIYFADRITEAHRQLIETYNRMHEGVVRVVPIDFPNIDFTTNERKEILARSLRGGAEGIDLFAVDVIWVQRFERWCEPLNPYFSEAEIRGFSDEGLQSCYKDGRLMAIPYERVQGVLLYREDLLKKLRGGDAIIGEINTGITWHDFLRYGESVEHEGPYYLYPAAEYEGLLCCFTEILLGRDGRYFAKHGFNFETPTARKALQFLVDLVHRYHVTPESATSMTEVSSYDYFISHNGLFLRGWTSYGKDFSTGNWNGSIRMAPLPHFADGRPASTIGGWDLMVSRFSTKKQEAVDFAKFLLRKESQEMLYEKGGFFPVIRALYEEEAYRKKFPELIAAQAMLAHGVDRPSHERYTKYSEILARSISQAIRGRISVDEALTQATRTIESEKVSLERVR